MGKDTRGRFIALLVLIALGLGSNLWFFVEKERVRTHADRLQQQVVEESAQLRADLETLRQTAESVQAQLAAAEKRLKATLDENEVLQATYQSLLDENGRIIVELEQARERQTALEQDLTEFERGTRLARVLEEKAALEREVAALRGGEVPRQTVPVGVVPVTADLEDLRARLEEMAKSKLQLEEKLRNEIETAQQLTRQLMQQRGGQLEVTQAAESLKRENATLRQDRDGQQQTVRSLEAEVSRLTAELEQSQTDREFLSKQIMKMDNVLGNRMEEIAKTRSVLQDALASGRGTASAETGGAVELPPIVVKERGVSQVGPREPTRVASGAETLPSVNGFQVPNPKLKPEGLRCRVINVNAQHNFVVLDVGELGGVAPGMVFGVYRRGAKIGAVSVIETRPRIAAADIQVMGELGPIRVDDIAILER